MTAWIGVADVEIVLQTDLSDDEFIDRLITHAQHLAEMEIGEQDPPNAKVKAVLAEVTARLWQFGQAAKMNPAGLQAETTGNYAYQQNLRGAAAMTVRGQLTTDERADLRQAAGKTGLWIQPTTRDAVETSPIYTGARRGAIEELLDVNEGEPSPWFSPDELAAGPLGQ